MASAKHKAKVVHRAVEGPSATRRASFLQAAQRRHLSAHHAAAGSGRHRSAWRSGRSSGRPALIRKAVIWLRLLKWRRACLKAVRRRYREHEVVRVDSASTVRPACSAGASRRDDGHHLTQPAGYAPRAVWSSAPIRRRSHQHGRALIHLVAQGTQGPRRYMTSGNQSRLRQRRPRSRISRSRSTGSSTSTSSKTEAVRERVLCHFMERNRQASTDYEESPQDKGVDRADEARSAALACGVPAEQLEFMEFCRLTAPAPSPRPPIITEIVDIVRLLERRHLQIYVAGEMSDTHGTHRTCAEASSRPSGRCAARDRWSFSGVAVSRRRGGNGAARIERVVTSARGGGAQEQSISATSREGRAMFRGAADRREFWQRAEDRNRGTANTYDRLGAPEFYALEGLVQLARRAAG